MLNWQRGVAANFRGNRGERDLAVSVDAQNFTFGGAPFTYYEQTRVTLLAPTGGPASAGRAVITVRGPSFAGGSDFRCRFGALAVRATPISAGQLTCTSPDQPEGAGGRRSVEVTMNGQQYSRSEVPFVYHAPEAVASLSPASGATAGETSCLLYTSPSPRDPKTSRMPSSA